MSPSITATQDINGLYIVTYNVFQKTQTNIFGKIPEKKQNEQNFLIVFQIKNTYLHNTTSRSLNMFYWYCTIGFNFFM